MILAISDSAWGFWGLLVTQTCALVALLINARRTRRGVDQVNRAVNHQPEGMPTLVERVGRIETEAAAHRSWEAKVFDAIGSQLGIDLPPPPPSHSKERP